MSQLSVKINLDASSYSDGIKQAAASTKEYTNQLTNITKNLPNAKREMNQMRKEAANLALVISRMSEAEKQSAEGQALIQHFNKIREEGAKMIDTIGDINAEMRAMASDTAGLDAAKQAIGVFGNALSSVAGVIGLVTGEEEEMKKAVVAFTTVQSTLNAITSISTALNKSSILVLKTKAIQMKAAALAAKMEAVAQNGNVVATTAATAAMRAFNTVAKANPIGLIITALTTVIGLFTLFTSGSDDATESMNEQRESAKRLAEEHTHAQKTIAERIADTTGKFIELAVQWRMLKTEAEQLAWIQNNKTAFQQLGLNIRSVTDAQEIFIKQLPRVLNVLKIQAEAAANLDLYIEQYKKRQERLANPNLGNGGARQAPEMTWRKILGGVDKYADYSSTKRQSLLADIAAEYGLKAGEDYNVIAGTGVGDTYFDQITTLTKAGEEKLKKITSDAARKRARIREEEEDASMKTYLQAYEERTRIAEEERGKIPQMYNPSTTIDPYKSTTSTRTPRTNQKRTVTKEHKETIKKEADKSTQEIKVGLDALEAQAKDLEDKRKKLIDTATGLPSDKNKAEFDRLTKDLTGINKKIETANKLLHPDEQKDEILSFTEQLSKEIQEYKKEYDLLMSKGNGSILEADKERALKIESLMKEKTKQLEQANNILENLTTEVILPEDKLIEDKIKEYQDIIDRNQLEIRINPTLSSVDKTKLKNEIDEARENKAKWEDAKDQRAAGAQYVIPEVVIGSKEKIDKKYEEYIKQVEAKWNNISPDLSKRLKPIVLDDLLFTSEKNLYQAQSSIREWAETGIRQVEEAFEKGLLPRQRAKDLIKTFNDELKRNHLDPIKVKIESKASKAIKGITEETFNAIGITNDLVSSYQNLQDTLDSEASGWEKAMAAVQLAQVAYNSIIKSIDMVTQILEVLGIMKKSDVAATSAQTAAKQANTEATVENTVATVADITASQTDAATSMVTTGAKSAEAIAGATASGAKVPFPGNLIAIAAGVAAVVAALAMISKFKFADGGVVGGHSYYGDKIIGRLNSGETILNQKQQKKVWEQMTNSSVIPFNNELHGEVTVRADQMKILMSNYDKKINKRK